MKTVHLIHTLTIQQYGYRDINDRSLRNLRNMMLFNANDSHNTGWYGQQLKHQMSGGKPSPVLVVEDEVHIRWMVSVLLKQQGYAVTEAHDGREALAILTDNP